MNQSQQLDEHVHNITNDQVLVHNSYGDVVQASNVLGHDPNHPTIAIPVGNMSQVEFGEEHFVTYVQNGQTYAIPLSSYETMQAENLLIESHQLESLPIDHHQPPEKENSSMISIKKNKRKTPNTSKTKNDDHKFGFMSGGWEIPKKTKYQIIPNLDALQKKAKLEPRYKPIRIDNWGIFLLNRIQAYFQRKDVCDLEIRFPEKDISIKTHKLILCSCSGMFTNEEKKGNLSDGLFEMPSTILPEAMTEILKFMYSETVKILGKLEVTEETIEPLLTAAKLLDMSVLTRLIESQKKNPNPTPEKKLKRINKDSSPVNPIQEAKKFRKIEMKIKEEGMTIERAEKLRHLKKLKKEREEAEKQKLPGKRLPIWINRNDAVGSNVLQDKPTALETSSLNIDNDQNVCRQQKAEKSNAVERDLKIMNTYQKRKDGEKPKIPRKLREMHEHLMFEKILKTGSKNSLFLQCEDKSENIVLEEDIKDLSKEHLERAKMIKQEDDMNIEYLDNSEFLVGDELDPMSVPNVADDDEINLPDTTKQANDISFNPEQEGDDNETEKSSKTLETPKIDKCANETTQSLDTPIPDDSNIDLDDTLKDFVKEAEEDSAQSNLNKPRRGRPPKSLQQFSLTNSDTNNSEMEDDVFKNQEKIIQELLKKNPHLLKSKKPIQLKIMVVNKGKKVAQTLTIKPVIEKAGKPGSSSHQDQKPMMPGFKPLPKVCYSGKQGRPRFLRPGEYDPHAQERKQIKENLMKVSPSIAKLVEGEETEQDENNQMSSQAAKETVQSRQNVLQSCNQISHDNTYTQFTDQTFVSQHTAQQIDKIPSQYHYMTSSVQEIYTRPVVAPPTTAMSSFIDIHQVPNTSPNKVSMVKYSHASGGELMHLQHGASNVLSNTAHQLQPGNTVHQLPPGNTVHQMPPGNTVYQLTPGNIAHQLPPGNTAHQLPPGAEIVQMVDQDGKYFYVIDMKSLGNIDASSNAIVLPYLPVVTGNTIQSSINTQEGQQHISLDNNSLIPITMTGVNTATIHRTGEDSREQYHVQHMVTAQNISTSNSISTTSNVTVQSRTATSNIPMNTTVSGGWMNLNTQHDNINQAQGTVLEPGKPVIQVTAANYQQQAQESPGALTGRTIQINVPLPASSTSHIDNHEQNKNLEQSNINVDDRKPVVQKLQQDWDSD